MQSPALIGGAGRIINPRRPWLRDKLFRGAGPVTGTRKSTPAPGKTNANFCH